MRRLPWMQVVAYALLALAVAATALAFAMLHAWESPVIPGAAPGYRYLALGYRRATGNDFSGIASLTMVQLRPLLPPGFGMGSTFVNVIDLAPQLHGAFVKLDGELVVGDILQALHVRPLLGRLITLDDQRHGAAVVLLSQHEARRLFGHARDALGKPIYTRQGFELRVIGVMPDDFHGAFGVIGDGAVNVWIPYTLMEPLDLGHWPKGMPKADMVKSMPFLGPAPLLSVPDGVSDAQLTVDLQRLLHNAHGVKIPRDVSGFVTAQPYSPFPSIQQTLQRRIRLALGLAAATLGLAAVNLLVVDWLVWLRRRSTFQIERVLGARRGYLLKRFALRTALSLLGMMVLSAALIAGAAVLLKHVAGDDYGTVLNLRSLLPVLAWALPLLVLVVAVAQGLPLGLLLARESLGVERVATATASDRWAGAAMIGVEVLLAALLSVASAWSIAQAWHSTHADLGFLDRPATVVATEMAGSWTGTTGLSGAAYRLALDRVENAVRAVAPGVPVGFGPVIVRGNSTVFPSTVMAGKRITSACTVGATDGWLLATGARILAGRVFDAGKVEKNAVLIDAQVARALFGSSRAAVGGTLGFQGAKGLDRVVGVVAPIDLHGADQPACPLVINSPRSNPYEVEDNGATLAIGRALDAGGRAQLRDQLAAVFARAGFKLKVTSVRTTDQERTWLAQQQIHQAHVFVVIALFAWAVALSGIFAQLRLFLAMRKRLTAIRSALGAGQLRLCREVVLGTLALAAAGVLLALLAAPWVAAQFAFLSGAQVAAFGAATWIALGVLLLAVFAVVHFPARRAARAEPAESLHEL